MTDDEGTAWTEFVHAGDKVKVMIISINAETKKIALGLKESLFAEVDEEDDDDEEMAADEDDEELEGSDDDEEDDSEIQVGEADFDDDSDDDDEMEVRLSSGRCRNES